MKDGILLSERENEMNDPGKETTGLRAGFSPLGMWAFSVGTSIGWGSFIVTCNTYLQKSGVLGTVFGLLLGMGVILLITWNLQYMIRSAPNAGGVYAFQKQVGGNDLGFLAFWFVLLTYLAILWANLTSLPLFARFFLGDAFHFGFHYRIFGYEVWFGEALLSVCAVLAVAILCIRSTRLLNHIMAAAVGIFSLGFTVCAVIALLRHDGSFPYEPLYAEDSRTFAQIVRIAVISPWAFIGFENIAHFSEEYAFPVRRVRRILLWSVGVTTLLYLFVALLSISAYPPEYASWLDYIRDMGSLDGIKAVPAFYAAQYYLGQTGVRVLMLALFAVILTSLIGNLLALSRLLYAAGRAGEAPRFLRVLNRRGIPENAVCAVAAVSVLIPFLGRTAIGWIVDVTTLGATLIYGLISYGVYRHARGAGRLREQTTGLAGLVLMFCFLLLLLIPGLLPFHAMETESYVLFLAWAVLGLLYFHLLIRREPGQRTSQRPVVWIILLLLMLFASMMWVSRATEAAADEAAQQIYDYHQAHPETDGSEEDAAARAAFLQEQSNQVTATNTLYTVVSLGLFTVSMAIMLNNYRDARRLGQRLSAAEEAARAAKTITEMTLFYVNLDTEDYIEYLTDEQSGLLTEQRRGTGFFASARREAEFRIHPEDRAAFIQGLERRSLLEALDRYKTFSMVYRLLSEQGPVYVSMKVSRMEKDPRFLVLGVSDVDEEMRQRREVEQARQQRLAFSRLNALTGDFLCVYVVVPETEDYREFSAAPGYERFALPKEGGEFFRTSREVGQRFIYPGDRARFLSLFNREGVLSEIRRSGIFSMSYRLVIDGKPTYVQLKAAMTEEKEGTRLIVGISNVDAHVRQEEEYARRLAQAQSKATVDALTGVQNRHAYLDAEEQLDRQIAEGRQPAFAIVILDVNDLKKVNDTAGHLAGDQYLRDAARIICEIFRENPIYRVGGDEFAVIVQGEDYDRLGALQARVDAHNREAARSGGIVIACGTAKYEGDLCVAPVFERADQQMYENKSALKAG